jgi:hypothetical protein
MTDEERARKWEDKVRPGAGMQQFDYWVGARYGYLAALKEERERIGKELDLYTWIQSRDIGRIIFGDKDESKT